MLEELDGDILIRRIVVGQSQRYLQHVEAVFGHPGRTVGLLEHVAARQHRRAVEWPDVVEPQKAALEYVVTERVLTVDPPREVDQQFLKGSRQEVEVGAAVDPEDG